MDPFNEYQEILEKYLLPETINLLQESWNEPHRVYHNIDPLNEVINLLTNQEQQRLLESDSWV